MPREEMPSTITIKQAPKGGPSLYGIDVIRDLRSLEECLSYPNTMETVEPKIVGMGGM
jgi:hypothetical protein